jgi:hypothetical protein
VCFLRARNQMLKCYLDGFFSDVIIPQSNQKCTSFGYSLQMSVHLITPCFPFSLMQPKRGGLRVI